MTKRIRFLNTIAVGAVAGILSVVGVALAAERASLIFDTEIENTIRDYAAPVLKAAGLDSEAVHIHIVRSKALNAFVAKGQRLFLTTGLIMAAEHPGQVVGVLAHETGHIAGGHLARLEGAMRDASTTALLSTLLAAAVGVLSGNPEAAVAVGTGSSQVITRNLLRYSRVQERSADRAAVDYLDTMRQSARGLLEFLRILDDQQVLIVSRRRQLEATYEVTHPLTRDRIAYFDEHVRNSRYADVPVPKHLIDRHERMVAKLFGFLNPQSRTFRRYKRDDKSIPARYARSIAFYRQADLRNALPLIDGLIDEHPGDPFFRELKGQILFENGRIEEALPSYEAAVERMPYAPLLRIELAHAQIELNRDDMLRSALANLRRAIRVDRMIPMAWRLSAVAYGRDGQLGMSALSSAEYNYLIGRSGDALRMADRAKRLLKSGSPGWLRAEDIRQAERKKSRRKKR